MIRYDMVYRNGPRQKREGKDKAVTVVTMMVMAMPTAMRGSRQRRNKTGSRARF